MKVWRILESLSCLEAGMARLYEGLRLHYSGDAESAAFFARLREEELTHRDIVRYQQRVMFKSPENYLDLADFDQGALEQSIRTVEDLIIREPGITLSEALRAAAAVETSATEQHYRCAVGRASPALAELVQNLGSRDEDHAARLNAFARSHVESPAWWTA